MIIDQTTLFNNCTADLQQAKMLQPERPATLYELCVTGAEQLGIDVVSDPYKSRLEHELSVIEGKGFEDYFFLMADLMQWARANMTTGPGRGSAAGSLVSYLLGITRVDPIKHDLLFFRFLDPSRSDWPDIDVDLSDRDSAIDYLVGKYGLHRVAKLGTVGNWQSLNATNEVAKALDLPRFAFNNLIDSLPSYAAGDDRADTALAVALEDMSSGQEILDKYPNFAVVKHMVGQPSHAGQHAAGVLVVDDAIDRYVAVDSRTNATMCDMRAAEALGLLKLDLLGLKTLSVIEETLRQIGMKSDDLDQLPLDDQAAFDVLNDGKFLGIFQFEGHALRNLTRTIRVTSFDDLSILSALSRPGASVGADAWVRRKKGEEEVTYPHEKLRPYLEETLGVLAYQEQMMLIAKDIGGLPWSDVTKLRKAIGKSQGEEALRPFEIPFKQGFADNGIDEETTNRVWRQFLDAGSYLFNKSHSVSYGYISYWTCYLKAHFPLEFAAASLTLANNADKQMEFLRELSLEGVTYVPVDPANSTDKWRVVGGKLIGPLQNIIGLGPKKVKEVLSARARGEPLSESLQKKLQNPQTALDKLFPLRDYLKTVDMARFVVQEPLMANQVQPNGDWQRDVRVIGVIEAIKERDENEEQRIQDRIERGQQGVKSGFTQFIEVRLKDDTTSNFYAKIGSRDYHGLRDKVDSCVVGKTVVVMKGTVPPEISMLLVENFKVIGEME